MRLQAMRLPDLLHGTDGDADCLGHRRAVQWVAVGGFSVVVLVTTCRMTDAASGSLPGGCVLSRNRPSTPSAANRACQRDTVGLDRPVRRMLVAARMTPQKHVWRDLVEMMAERGLSLARTTIMILRADQGSRDRRLCLSRMRRSWRNCFPTNREALPGATTAEFSTVFLAPPYRLPRLRPDRCQRPTKHSSVLTSSCVFRSLHRRVSVAASISDVYRSTIGKLLPKRPVRQRRKRSH
jgi:hypothetical protein